MPTFAIARQGPGGTAANAVTQIGENILLPANGPWIIHGVWGQVVKATTVPAEGTGGILLLNSVSGDIEPDPAPGRWPLIGSPISESANAALSAVPLNIWPTLLSGAGKAQVNLSYQQDQAITTASEVACGIIFGNEVPVARAMPFVDSVGTQWASAAETQVGSITLAEKATRITGIMADLNKADASTTAEEVLATIRLDSQDVKFPPSQYPCLRAFNASDGTAVGQSAVAQAQFIPVDIPVIGGSIIDVFVTSSISVTSNASIRVFIGYE
jgi:hypothetical protein